MDSPTIIGLRMFPVQIATATEEQADKKPRWGAVALKGELPLIFALVLVGLVVQSLNMFHYPALNRVDDEGIYASQAWAVLRQGQLAPYTYFYDHAPVGWMLIAAWYAITGGPTNFGGAIDSGRLFMLVLHLGMVVMLYRVTRKLGCNIPVAVVATLLFSISPLAIYFQRFLLLDNIMMFWILLSLDLLLDGWGRLSRVVLSGLCFGIAMLSKETAVFIVPAMLFVAWQQRWKHQGRFALLGWIIPVATIVSFYPLYALVKGELLPAGASLAFFVFNVNVPSSHVSLIDALKWQSTRTGGGPFNLGNMFWQLARDTWIPLDPILFIGGGLASVANLVRGIVLRNRRALAAALFGLLPLLYLARGGIVFDYYIIFAIPFLCLNVALLIHPLLARLPSPAAYAAALLSVVLLVGVYWANGSYLTLFSQQPDTPSREATAWIKANVPAQSYMIIGDDMWTDLHEADKLGPSFPNAESVWKVGLDPAILNGVFHNDWQKVDYLVVTSSIEQDMSDNKMTMALDALSHSHVVKTWSAEGNTIELRQVDKTSAASK